jgi:hypothetical protein
MGNVQLYIQSRGEGGRGDCARVLCATEKKYRFLVKKETALGIGGTKKSQKKKPAA